MYVCLAFSLFHLFGLRTGCFGASHHAVHIDSYLKFIQVKEITLVIKVMAFTRKQEGVHTFQSKFKDITYLVDLLPSAVMDEMLKSRTDLCVQIKCPCVL